MSINWRPISEFDKSNCSTVYLFCTDEGVVHCGQVYNECAVYAYDDYYCVNLDAMTHFAKINLPTEYA